jgi:AraC family transcriptional regulator
MSDASACSGATPDSNLAPPRFEEGRALRIAGLSGRFNTATCGSEVPLLWNRFGPQIGQVPGQVGGVAYGVVYDGNPQEFSYLAGVEVAADATLPEDYTTLDIPAHRYAVFTHAGSLAQLSQTLAAIWGDWVPKSGITDYSAPCYERYAEDFCPEAGKGGIEIWIPVRST